jgi:hypothetical protein
MVVVIVVAAMVKIVAEVIVVVPALVSAVPPLTKVVVTAFALFAEIFHPLRRFVTVLSVLGDRSVELGLRFLGVVPALLHIVVRANARCPDHEHQSCDYHPRKRRTLA